MAAISSTDVYDAPQATLSESAPEIKTGLFSAKGRLGVLKYMAHSLVLMLAMMAIFGVMALLAGVSLSEPANSAGVNPLLISVSLVAILPGVWIGIVMMIKRLHDLNLSGWFILLTLIPVLGIIVSLFIMCAPGMKEGNKFGPLALTATWEKVLGIIGLAFFIVTMIASVVAMVAPSVMGLM